MSARPVNERIDDDIAQHIHDDPRPAKIVADEYAVSRSAVYAIRSGYRHAEARSSLAAMFAQIIVEYTDLSDDSSEVLAGLLIAASRRYVFRSG